MASQQQLNGTQILVGNPTDANFGSSPNNVNVPNVQNSDKLTDALDKIVGIIDKLAPGKSPNLSTKVLSLQGDTFYTARHVSSTSSVAGNYIWSSGLTVSATPGSTYTKILFTSKNPLVRVSDSTAANSGYATFSDGQSGTLQAKIDYQVAAYKTLETGYWSYSTITAPPSPVSPDIGVWDINGTQSSLSCLGIAYDNDPYNLAPNTGFWTSLKATMSGTQSFVTGNQYDGFEHVYNVAHTTTGATPDFTFICDNGDGTTINALFGNPYFQVVSYTTRWTSGIPGLEIGSIVSASYSIANTLSGGKYPLISRFYNQSNITDFSMVFTTGGPDTVGDLDGSGIPKIGGTYSLPYAYQPTWSIKGLTNSISTGRWSLNTLFSFRAFNSKGNQQSISSTYNIGNYGAAAGKTLYVDTVSNETLRVRSGDGQYPSFGTVQLDFGQSYNSFTASNLQGGPSSYVSGEMMLQNGQFKYPSGDYSNNFPVSGWNYNSIDNSTNYSTYRWATFNVGTVASATSFVLTISGSSGITGIPTIGMLMYVTIVNGGVSQVGWLDANQAYNSGNPSSNGDSCVDLGSSTATSRRITLGSISRTGTVYVRIGFPSGSTKYLTNITKT